MKAFRYILRYCIDPDFEADRRIEEIVAYCDESLVDEVMLFILPEELNTGYWIDAELDKWIAMACRLKAALDQVQVGLSLNPWLTLAHSARGRGLRTGQNFAPMVGETGAASPLAACPLCPNWRSWLCRTYGRMAAEVAPVAIWVEDDFRLHNHDPELGWGGCFCDRHLAEFAGEVGQAMVTRQDLLTRILAAGEPDPWRAQWLKLSRQTMLTTAKLLAEAVRQAGPNTQLGLMSSSPDVHSIEDRDWHALQKILAPGQPLLTRPTMPPYSEMCALVTVPSDTRYTIANLECPIVVYPELENSPRSGRYSKSASASIWQCLHAAAMGSHGITINHYDMMGNGIELDPTFGRYLKKAKPQLNAVRELGIEDNQAQGLRILFDPRVAAHRRLQRSGRTMQDLINPSVAWSQRAYVLGIAHGFIGHVSRQRRDPVAVSGQTLWALDEQAIERLLSGPVLLDAASAAMLLERGYGAWIGIDSARWLTLQESAYSYESILESDESFYGRGHPRLSAQRCANRILAMTPTPGAQVLSEIRRADHTPVAPGLITSRNPQGGYIAIIAYPLLNVESHLVSFANVFRRRLVQRLLFQLAPGAPLAVAEEAILHLYRQPTQHGVLLAALNPTADSTDQIVLRLGDASLDATRIQQLDDQGRWRPYNVELQNLPDGSTRLRMLESLAPLTARWLLCG